MLSNDSALVDPNSDLLGYAPFAKSIARGLLESHAIDGLVVALYGRWGAGKSSLLSFIQHYIRQADEKNTKILEFNPWWFSGAEDLAENFFAELNRVVSPVKAASSALETLWKYTSPVVRVGGAIAKFYLPEKATALLDKAIEVLPEEISAGLSRKTSFADAKQKLIDALKGDESKRIIIIDDIDRLSTQEIAQLFRLVKNVANLPNTIYLLAFDREIVAAALSAHPGADGNAYLEKIVQVAFDLPPPEAESLTDMLWERLVAIVDGTPSDLAQEQDLRAMYFSGVNKLITKPRDITRLINTLSVTYPAVKGEVNAADFIALEAIRLFCPGLYNLIRENSSMFLGGRAWVPSQIMAATEFHKNWRARKDWNSAAVGITAYLFPQLSHLDKSPPLNWPADSSGRRRLRICFGDFFPVYFRFGLGHNHISNEHLRNLIRCSEDEMLIVAEIDRRLQLDESSTGSHIYSLITRMSDQEFSPMFASFFLKALLIRSNDILQSAERRGRWIVPIFRDALGRLAMQVGQLRPLVEGALKVGQVSGVLHLVWMAENHDESGGRWISGEEKNWIEKKIVDWFSQASFDALLRLPASYLGYAFPLWSKREGWDAIRTKFEDAFVDPQSMARLLSVIKVEDALLSIRSFGNALNDEFLRELFSHERGMIILRDLSSMDPTQGSGSEDAAKLLSYLHDEKQPE